MNTASVRGWTWSRRLMNFWHHIEDRRTPPSAQLTRNEMCQRMTTKCVCSIWIPSLTSVFTRTTATCRAAHAFSLCSTTLPIGYPNSTPRKTTPRNCIVQTLLDLNAQVSFNSNSLNISSFFFSIANTQFDAENVGPMDFTPYQGFSSIYFPFKGQRNYMAPFVTLRLPSPTHNVGIGLTCRLLAKDLANQTESTQEPLPYIPFNVFIE